LPPESSRQGQKLLLSLIGAVCAFLATRKIMFHSKWERRENISYSQVCSKKKEVLWMNFEPVNIQMTFEDFMEN